MTISQRIFALMESRGLSQKDLAKYAGISPAAITSWKKRHTTPSADKIAKISAFLGVSERYLLTGSDETFSENVLLMEDIAEISPQLSKSELRLLKLFRVLPEFEQGRILGIVESAVDNCKL